MARKLVTLVFIVALLLTAACSYGSDPGPAPIDDGPSTDNGNEEQPVVTDPDSDPTPESIPTVVWETRIDRNSSLELIDGHLVLFSTDRIYSIDVSTGDFLWERNLKQDGYGMQDGYASGLFISHEGKDAITYILIKNDETYIEHLDISTGEELWQEPLPGMAHQEVLFWADEDLVYVYGSISPNPMLIRLDDGQPLAHFSTDKTINCFEDYYYTFPDAPTSSYTLAKYDYNGVISWETQLDTQGEDYSGSDVVRLIDDIVLQNVYQVTGDQVSDKVFAIDEQNGTVLWTKEGSIRDTMMVDNQPVFCLKSDDKFSLLEATTGQAVTEFIFDGIWVTSTNNTVYISWEDSLKPWTLRQEKSCGRSRL